MVFSHLTPRLTALLLFVLSVLALAAVLGLEHIGGYLPCQMCLWQRIPFWWALPLALAAFALGDRRLGRVVLWVLALGFTVGAGIAVWHAGVEWKWWEGPNTCGGGGAPPSSLADLTRALAETIPVPCDEAALRIAGLSLAGYNVFLSLGMAALAGWGAWKKP